MITRRHLTHHSDWFGPFWPSSTNHCSWLCRCNPKHINYPSHLTGLCERGSSGLPTAELFWPAGFQWNLLWNGIHYSDRRNGDGNSDGIVFGNQTKFSFFPTHITTVSLLILTAFQCTLSYILCASKARCVRRSGHRLRHFQVSLKPLHWETETKHWLPGNKIFNENFCIFPVCFFVLDLNSKCIFKTEVLF